LSQILISNSFLVSIKNKVNSEKLVTCKYSSKKSILSCSSIFRQIECDTLEVYQNSHNFTKLTENFQQFAISPTSTQSSLTSACSFKLYPKNTNEYSLSLWLDHILFNNKIDKQMCLFSGDESEQNKMFGFKIVNSKCFTQMRELFNAHTHEEIIQVGYSSRNVNIFGMINVE
jgi:hypothetical protein